MKTLGRFRQRAVRRRLDLEPAIAGLVTEARIIVADIGLDVDVAAAIDRRLAVIAAAEAELALDYRIGCIDAVDDDGHAGTAGNHNVKTLAGQARRRRSDRNGQN